MNSIIRHLITATLVATLGIAFAASAGASDESGLRKITVKFGDLDVSTSQGAASLYTRIRAAAIKVCSQPDPIWNSRSCVDKAVTEAVSKVNRPALFAVYNDHYKTSLKPSQLLSQAR
jgi:UrcA family protein